MRLKVDPKRAAVVVIDMQNGCGSPEGFAAKVLKRDVSPIVSMSKKIPGFLDKARAKGAEIIWIRTEYCSKKAPKNIYEVETSAGYPFPDMLVKGTPDYDFFGSQPRKGEKEFVKTQPNAMEIKAFEKYLKKRRIDTLIFVGVWASRCVFCSLVGAAGRGYRCIFVKDLCENVRELAWEKKAAENIVSHLLGFVLSSEQTLKLLG
jgi:nicotinamidase-related amidase